MLGLKRGTVSVTEHDGSWKNEAACCISVLRDVLQEDAVDVQHIGSTAIPGLCAKPILDIAVGVRDLADVRKHDAELASRGFLYRTREHGDQLLYVCGDMEKDTRTHHVHVVLWGSRAWNDYLDLRDYLTAHRQEAEAYARLKEGLALQYPEDRRAYTAGKEEHIRRILEKAAAWRARQLPRQGRDL